MKRLPNKAREQMLPDTTPPSTIDRHPACAADPLQAKDPAVLAEALSNIFRLQHQPLLRFLSRRTGSRAEAEDIIQDAYVRILASARTDAIQALDRYLWRSALNIATDHGRTRQRWNRIAETLSMQDAQVTPSAEAAADARERWTLLNQAVSELPSREHQAFILRIGQSLPFEDVGQAMRISSRMAKIYVARTLVYLQHRLEGGDARGGVTTRRRSRVQTQATPRHVVCGHAIRKDSKRREMADSSFRADQAAQDRAQSHDRQLVLPRPSNIARS